MSEQGNFKYLPKQDNFKCLLVFQTQTLWKTFSRNFCFVKTKTLKKSFQWSFVLKKQKSLKNVLAKLLFENKTLPNTNNQKSLLKAYSCCFLFVDLLSISCHIHDQLSHPRFELWLRFRSRFQFSAGFDFRFDFSFHLRSRFQFSVNFDLGFDFSFWLRSRFRFQFLQSISTSTSNFDFSWSRLRVRFLGPL